MQIPTTYELLVWDTAGDGSGSGAGGIVKFDTTGANTNSLIDPDPSGQRLVSLVSTEQIATFQISSSSGNRGVPLCSSVADCNSGAMAMFVDAYKNTGYLEFGLGWSSGANSPTADASHSVRGTINQFYIIVELEDNSPDATPPQVAYDGHYTDITSYVPGSRTLYLSVA